MQEPEAKDLERCIFVAQYERVGVNQWIRIGRPEIQWFPTAVADQYRIPVLHDATAGRMKPTFQVRLFDPQAVALEKLDRLGDWIAAAERCDRALLKHFEGDVIVENLCQW